MLQTASREAACRDAVLQNLTLEDQGAPPTAARCARRVGEGATSIAARPATAPLTPAGLRGAANNRDRSTATSGVSEPTKQSKQLPQPQSSNATSTAPRAHTRRCAMASPPLTPPTWRYEPACRGSRGGPGNLDVETDALPNLDPVALTYVQHTELMP